VCFPSFLDQALASSCDTLGTTFSGFSKEF
jgi:hypothetical protein